MIVSAADVAAVLRRWEDGRRLQGHPTEWMLGERLNIISYHCQGHHLALHGEPLFREDILAGPWGPVVNIRTTGGPVINAVAASPDNSLVRWSFGDPEALSQTQHALVERLALKAEDEIHLELRATAKATPPWQYANDKRTEAEPFPVIHHNDMARYYRALLDAPRTAEEYAARCMWADRYRTPLTDTAIEGPEL